MRASAVRVAAVIALFVLSVSVLAGGRPAAAATPVDMTISGGGRPQEGSSLSWIRGTERYVLDPHYLGPLANPDVGLRCIFSFCLGSLALDLGASTYPIGGWWGKSLGFSLFIGTLREAVPGSSASWSGTIIGFYQEWISPDWEMFLPIIPVTVPLQMTVQADGRYSYTTGYFDWHIWEHGIAETIRGPVYSDGQIDGTFSITAN